MHFLNEQSCLIRTFSLLAIVSQVVLLRLSHLPYLYIFMASGPQFTDIKQEVVLGVIAISSLKLEDSFFFSVFWLSLGSPGDK